MRGQQVCSIKFFLFLVQLPGQLHSEVVDVDVVDVTGLAPHWTDLGQSHLFKMVDQRRSCGHVLR